jgi:hypothetical protein
LGAGETARNRDQWRLIVKEAKAKAHPGQKKKNSYNLLKTHILLCMSF